MVLNYVFNKKTFIVTLIIINIYNNCNVYSFWGFFFHLNLALKSGMRFYLFISAVKDYPKLLTNSVGQKQKPELWSKTKGCWKKWKTLRNSSPLDVFWWLLTSYERHAVFDLKHFVPRTAGHEWIQFCPLLWTLWGTRPKSKDWPWEYSYVLLSSVLSMNECMDGKLNPKHFFHYRSINHSGFFSIPSCCWFCLSVCF